MGVLATMLMLGETCSKMLFLKTEFGGPWYKNFGLDMCLHFGSLITRLVPLHWVQTSDFQLKPTLKTDLKAKKVFYLGPPTSRLKTALRNGYDSPSPKVGLHGTSRFPRDTSSPRPFG